MVAHWVMGTPTEEEEEEEDVVLGMSPIETPF